MKLIRDLLLTAVVLCILAAGLMALPFLFAVGLTLCVLGLAWIIYAYIHDARLEREKEEKLETNED